MNKENIIGFICLILIAGLTVFNIDNICYEHYNNSHFSLNFIVFLLQSYIISFNNPKIITFSRFYSKKLLNLLDFSYIYVIFIYSDKLNTKCS